MLRVSEIEAAIKHDAPSDLRRVFSATLSEHEPGWVGPVAVVRIEGAAWYIGTDGRADDELAAELASIVQDFIADSRGRAWPTVVDEAGNVVGVLDISAAETGLIWSHKNVAPIPLGRLHEEAQRRGLSVAGIDE